MIVTRSQGPGGWLVLGLGVVGLGLTACGTGDGGAGGAAADARASAGGANPDAVVATPDAVVANPDAVVATPDAVVANPDAVVADPDAVVANPDAVVADPDAVVADPDAVVVDPDAVVANPDAVVANPDAVVANPDSGAADPDAAGPEVDAAPPEPDAAVPRVMTVCPDGCDFAFPSEAARAVSGGEIVEIQAGEYVDCATWPVSVTLRGVGLGRAYVRDAACGDKAIWTTQGADTVVENVEFSGMAVADRNGAGIRHEGGRLVVRNVYMHDGEQGLLAGANPEASVVIEDSFFERLGQDGQAHAVYVNQIASLVVRNSVFLSSQNEGHELKSRALRTLIECSVIASLDGVDSRSIDLPNGGDVEIRGSVIQQGAASANHEIIGYGLEAPANPNSRFVMTDSVILNDAGLGTFVHFAGDPMMGVQDNVFVGRGTLQVGGDPFGVNTTFPDRESAMLPAEPVLPEPNCGP